MVHCKVQSIRIKYFISTANNLDLDDKYPVLNYEDENDLLGEFTQIKKLLRFSFQKGKMEELYEDYGELKLEEWLRIKLKNV